MFPQHNHAWVCLPRDPTPARDDDDSDSATGYKHTLWEGFTQSSRVDLQFQSHQEHVQPLAPLPHAQAKRERETTHTPDPFLFQYLSPRRTDRWRTWSIPRDESDSQYLAIPIDVLCDPGKAPRLSSPNTTIAKAYCALSTKHRHGIVTAKDVSRVDRIYAALRVRHDAERHPACVRGSLS
jgi:hypothetical protein